MKYRVAQIIVKNPYTVMFFLFSLTTYFVYYSMIDEDTKLDVDFSLEQMFPESDPEKDIYENFKKDFSREDDIFMLVYNKGQNFNPFDKKNINTITMISEQIHLLDGIEKVLSIGYVNDENPFADASNDSLYGVIENNIKNNPLFNNQIISDKNKTAAIMVNLEDKVQTQDQRQHIISQIDTITEKYAKTWNWYEAGIPILRTRYIELVNHERMIFIPISMLVVVFVLFVVFRQKRCVIIPVVSISMALIWVAALMSFLGISINVVSYLTFNLLMIIGVSDAIHLLMKYHEGLNKGLNQSKSLHEVIDKIGGALFLTSFTTAVGFFSLILTNVRVTREFGLIVGLGVIVMFIVTIISMPTMLAISGVPRDNDLRRIVKNNFFKYANRLCINIKDLKYQISILSIIILLFSFLGLLRINHNITLLDDLRPGNELYDSIAMVEKDMGGTLPLEIVISHNDKELFFNVDGNVDIEYLLMLENFEFNLEAIKEIGSILTVLDYLKFSNNNAESVADISNDDIDDFFNFVFVDGYPGSGLITDDYKKTRFSCRVNNVDTDQSRSIKKFIKQYYLVAFKDYKYKDDISEKNIIITGSTFLSLNTSKHLVDSLTSSFLIAFVIIFISMSFMFKSTKLAIVSILPNVIPLIIAGGVMGYLGIKLRPSTAMTFSIALGIAVDDTIHFLSRFKYELINNNNDMDKALVNTLETSGQAIISTTIILSLGFLVLTFSEFVPNHEFGILATIVLVTALLTSMLLIPALIYLIKPKIKNG